jgi:hypothetical protein
MVHGRLGEDRFMRTSERLTFEAYRVARRSSGVRAREGREVVARVHWPRYSVMYLIRFGLCS